MISSPSVLNQIAMQDALARRGVTDLFVEVFDSLPSTSAYLSVIANKSADQSVRNTNSNSAAADRVQLCVADWQTDGSGRRGRSWVTDRGNVTFSLLMSIRKPPAQLLGLSLVTGICVAESLSELANLTVQLKWPNDVLVEDQKLCGLLTELISSTNDLTRVVVGIGINYKQPGQIEQADYQAVSLPLVCESTPERADIISDVSARIIDAYALFEQHGWSEFAERWNRFDYLKGRQVRVINAGVEEHAIAVGVDSHGALMIERDAKISVVYSGDVSVRLA